MRILGKRGIEQDILFWIIVGVITLAILIGGYYFLGGKLPPALEYIKDIILRK